MDARALLFLLLAGCGDVVAQPIGAAAAGADGGGTDSSTGMDGPDAGGDGTFGDGAGFCSGQGPVQLPGSDKCTGDVARFFRFAACSCTSFAVSGQLTTTSYDSTTDAGPSNTNAASIAANGAIATNAQTIVGGSIFAGGQGVVAGSPAVALQGSGAIVRDVQSGGDVQVGGTYQVAGDLFAEGNVTLTSGGSLSVAGAVHVPPGDSATGVSATGGIVTGPVQVAPPCDCSNLIDVASIVAGRKTSNDDAAIGLAVTAFDQPSPTVQLPCGQYWVDGISGTGTVTLDVQGRVALYVGGDVSIQQGLDIVFTDPAAELDLFVAGSVSILGGTTIGDLGSPAHVRLYIAGTSLTLAANAMVGANVYAPNAVVALASNFGMRGAIFAQQLQFSGNFDLAYDTSVLQVPGCTPPGAPCKTCDDCPSAAPACKGGTCQPCVTAADCCAPLACVQGACVLELE